MNYTLHHGDCLAIMAGMSAFSVDAIVADPPYSSGGFTRSDRSADPSSKYVQTGVEIVRESFSGDNRDGRSWCYWMALWMSEACRLVKESGYMLVFTDWRQLPLASDALQAGGFVWRGIIPWDKTSAARAPHTGYFRHQCEFVVWGTKGVSVPSTWGGPWDGYVRQLVKQSDKFHMTGKPVGVMEHLIQCVPPGGTVLDPFMGSGSTGVAALRQGRKFVGIEMNRHYFDVASKRIERTSPSLLLPQKHDATHSNGALWVGEVGDFA